VPEQPSQSSDRFNRACAFLLGLHGLALVVVFPLGPQQTRLWHPGVAGIATLVAAYPLAAVVGGLLARRLKTEPASLRALAILAALALLPSVFSLDYPTFFGARLFGGFIAGFGLVALHRVMPAAIMPAAGRTAARIIAFGLPVCVLAATLMDWRSTFVPLLAGAVALAVVAPDAPAESADEQTAATEAAPAALVATGALAFVSSAYLTILSGFLVRNAGHSELHITAALLTGAGLGVIMPFAVSALRQRLSSFATLGLVLAASACSLASLLVLRAPLPAALAVTLLGCFLAINGARHVALAGLVWPRLTEDQLPVHQTNTHLAHHAGSGIGALIAGCLIHVAPEGGLTGMGSLLGCALGALTLVWAAGLTLSQPTASPAARAASANTRWRVAASLVRSVRTSMTRTPGSPT